MSEDIQEKAKQLFDEILLQITEQREILAKKMTAEGMLPEKGWAISDNIEDVLMGKTMEYKCKAEYMGV